MRRTSRHSIWLALIIVPLLVLGAGSPDEAKEKDDGIDVYFRDGDLLAVTPQALPNYPDTATGESKRLGRDFPDAPPQIPHTIEDMYPITPDDNECVDCHHPDNAISKSDIPLPESHFRAPVMGAGAANDPMIWIVKDYEKIKDVVGARYNCSMCHTPQADNVKTENDFVAEKKPGKK